MMPTVSNEAPRKADGRPRIVVVADDKCDLALLSAEIEGRYGGAYNVLVQSSPGEALTSLEALRVLNHRVAVVVASQRMGEMSGSNLLSIAR
jgi:CheY-like chemotaxis protein